MWTLHFAGPGTASRSCIFVRSTIYAFSLLEFGTECDNYEHEYIPEKGALGNLLVPQFTSHVIQTTPIKELLDIVDYCSSNTMLLIT